MQTKSFILRQKISSTFFPRIILNFNRLQILKELLLIFILRKRNYTNKPTNDHTASHVIKRSKLIVTLHYVVNWTTYLMFTYLEIAWIVYRRIRQHLNVSASVGPEHASIWLYLPVWDQNTPTPDCICQCETRIPCTWLCLPVRDLPASDCISKWESRTRQHLTISASARPEFLAHYCICHCETRTKLRALFWEKEITRTNQQMIIQLHTWSKDQN